MPHKREKYAPKHRQAKHRAETTPFFTVAPRKVDPPDGDVLVGRRRGDRRRGLHRCRVQPARPSAAPPRGSPTSPSRWSPASSDDQTQAVSRSDRRDTVDPAKEAALTSTDGPAVSRTEDISDDDPREIARALLAEFGYSADQFGCLDSLYMSESGWRVDADNPSSSAYGIPQALPGEKMASAGADWATNPVDPDPLGPRLHPGPLRLAVRRLELQAGQRLVLTRHLLGQEHRDLAEVLPRAGERRQTPTPTSSSDDDEVGDRSSRGRGRRHAAAGPRGVRRRSAAAAPARRSGC